MNDKVFWLSFCDTDRQKGEQFLGACLIRVTPDEATEARNEMERRFALAPEGGEWVGAALKKAQRLGCNPGGEVASVEIDLDEPNLSRYTFGVLMSRDDVEGMRT